MPSIVDTMLQSKMDRRVFGGLLFTMCVLCVVLGVFGLTYCICDLNKGKCNTKVVKPTTLPPANSMHGELDINHNTTANCTKGIHIGDFMYIHVCWYNSEILLDIRQFSKWDSRPTIKGVGLKKTQWIKLTQEVGHINQSIVEKEYEHRIFKYQDWHL